MQSTNSKYGNTYGNPYLVTRHVLFFTSLNELLYTVIPEIVLTQIKFIKHKNKKI